MTMTQLCCVCAGLLLVCRIATAADAGESLTGDALYNSDKAPDSMLYDLPQEVVPGVWSAIGATAPGTYANSGHNNNLSFVITDAGVLVVNAGANYLLAKALHDEIKKVTDQPVKYVVIENGGTLQEAYEIDQSPYMHLPTAEFLAKRNAGQVFQSMEFEF